MRGSSTMTPSISIRASSMAQSPIAHFGCAIRIYLVVTGPLAGQVWTDDRAGDQGIYPCEPVQFTHWYLRWLEEAERHLGADS
jgi:hypothetical protein